MSLAAILYQAEGGKQKRQHDKEIHNKRVLSWDDKRKAGWQGDLQQESLHHCGTTKDDNDNEQAVLILLARTSRSS